jgi:hypothetical protein
MALKSLAKLLTVGRKRLWIGVEEVKLRNKLKNWILCANADFPPHPDLPP